MIDVFDTFLDEIPVVLVVPQDTRPTMAIIDDVRIDSEGLSMIVKVSYLNNTEVSLTRTDESPLRISSLVLGRVHKKGSRKVIGDEIMSMPMWRQFGFLLFEKWWFRMAVRFRNIHKYGIW